MPEDAITTDAPPRGWWPRDRRVFEYAGFVLLASLAFLLPLVALAKLALKEELHSHIVLIPLVSIYLAGIRRNELPASRRRSPVAAAIFALLAAAVYFVPRVAGWHDGWSASDQISQSVACYLLLLTAGGFAFLGKSWMRLLAFPFAFLIFMIPMPDALVLAMESVLMRLSADLSEILFRLTDTPVFRHGQVLELPGMTLQIARECSGIRSTLVLFITSLLASYMFLQSVTHRTLLVAMVIPLGIFRNAIRVLVIGLLCVHVRPEMIDSWIHHQGGPLFFAVSLVPLFLAAWWFRHRENRRKRATGKSASAENSQIHPKALNPSIHTESSLPS